MSTQANFGDSSSSGSSSSGRHAGDVDDEPMDDDELLDNAASEERISQLLKTVEEEPKNYESRMLLIKLLRQSGELDAVREQRETAIKMFTLPAYFWLEWIEDEKNCESDNATLKRLFEKAVKDFHSPDVYLEYVQWACGMSIEYAREKMEEAVSKVGFRPDCAALVWNVYLDLEKMVLNSLDGEKAEKHRGLIDELYSRLFRIPHIGIDETWNEYTTFAGDRAISTLRATFEKTAKKCAEIIEFEDLLKNAKDVEKRLSIFNEYIDFEMQTSDPARIQMIFERALDTFASLPDSNVWLQYGSWLDFSLKLPEISVGVYARAVKHAPCAALWQQYFSAMERANVSDDDIDAKWPEAIESIVTKDEGASLFRTYIYLLKRRACKTESPDYTKVLKLFEDGITFLSDKFGTHWDSPKAQYRKNYAVFLYTFAKQPDKGRKIWNDILASGNGHLASMWLEGVNLERYFGNLGNARKMLYRAINSASDHPYTTFEALVQFEREVGTLDELDRALEKVNAQHLRISTRPQKSKSDAVDSKKRKKDKAQTSDLNPINGDSRKLSASVKIAAGAKKSSDEPDAKRIKKVFDGDGFVVPMLPEVLPKVPKDSTSSSSTSDRISSDIVDGIKCTVFVSNLDFKVPTEKIKEIFPKAKEVRLVYRGMSKLHKGFGYVDFASADDAAKALEKDRTQIEGRPMYVSEYKPHDKNEHAEFRFSTGIEKNKVYVSNLHYDAVEEQLREIFIEFGAIREIRVVTHKSGKSKGCAYIEYENEESALSAVKQSGNIVLLERKLSVAISNPPQRKEEPAAKIFASHQRSKIDLLPRSLTRIKPSEKTGRSISENSVKKMSNDQFRSFLK